MIRKILLSSENVSAKKAPPLPPRQATIKRKDTSDPPSPTENEPQEKPQEKPTNGKRDSDKKRSIKKFLHL